MPRLAATILSLALTLVIGSVGLGLTSSSALAAPTLEQLKSYVRRHPENFKAVYHLGRLYAREGNYAQAIRLWMYVVKRGSSSRGGSGLDPALKLNVLNRIGLAYFKQGEVRRAAKVWQFILKAYPGNPFALKGMAAIRKRNAATGGASVAGGDRPGGPAGTEGPGKRPAAPVSKVSPEEAERAFDRSMTHWIRGRTALEQGNNEKAEPELAKAREGFKTSVDGGYRVARSYYYIGDIYLKEAFEIEKALEYFEKAREVLRKESPKEQDDLGPDITFGIAMAHGLLGDNEKEIAYLEKTLEARPDSAEVHFQAALAYDRSGKEELSAKSFEHAKLAIRLDPEYKKRFQPLIRTSKVARKVAGIIQEIIEKSEDQVISEDEAEEYANQIGRILGEKNLNSELGGGQGGSRQRLKELIRDPSKRKKLGSYLKGRSPREKAELDRYLKSNRNASRLKKYLGTKNLQDVLQGQGQGEE